MDYMIFSVNTCVILLHVLCVGCIGDRGLESCSSHLKNVCSLHDDDDEVELHILGCRLTY